MKLKDIFPRYLLREKSYGDLELGGGSAFAHLSEDAASGFLGATLPVLVSPDPDRYWNGDGQVAALQIHPSGVLQAQLELPNNGAVFIARAAAEAWHRFEVDVDGSLHWGDGTAAPDTSLARTDVGVLGVAGATSGVFLNVAGRVEAYSESDAAADVFLSSLWADDQARFRIHADGAVLWGDGTAAPDTRLARKDAATLESDRFVVGGSDDVESYWNGDGSGLVTDVGPGQIQVQSSSADSVALSLAVTGGVPRFAAWADGSLHWGDGTAAPDTGLKRDGGDMAIWAGPSRQITLYEDADDSGNDIYFKVSIGQIRVSAPGGSLQLHSPDGTAYNITVANDGTVTSVAA